MRIEDEGTKDAGSKRMDLYQQMQERHRAEDAKQKPAAETSAEIGQQQDQVAERLEAEITGSELHAQAVDAAGDQQDRGEAWMGFGDKNEGSLPPSVEDLKAQEKQDAMDEQDQRERISVQELQNQFKINNGGIRG
ncbi:MAG: hypothetical protein AAFX94_20040 [Myxococcota bacterium]